MSEPKIKIEALYKIFGKNPKEGMEHVKNGVDKNELLEKYDSNLVEFVLKKIYQNQFKRKMPIIAKLKSRTITHDFLYERDIRL